MLTLNRLWSPEINHKFIRAAIRAGLPETVDLCHEPEAASIYCLADRLQQMWRPYNGVVRELSPFSLTDERSSANGSDDGNFLAILSSILILDAGSGTVDLVPYKLHSKGANLEMREGVRGTGTL